MSWPSPNARASRRCCRTRSFARRAGLALVASLAFAASVGAEGEGEDAPMCDPIDAPGEFAPLAPSVEPGPRLAPGSSRESGLGRHVGVAEGSIVSLAEGSGAPIDQQVGGEALLVMPKREDGTIASRIELAPGARVIDSFWSPVLCATVARVVGDPLAQPFDLVATMPDDATLSPNHVYVSAASEVETIDASETDDPYRKLQHGLDRLGVALAQAVSTGTGVRVAVLDSAPEASHRDLVGVEVAPFAGGPETAPAVHGTLTAGVIGAVPHNGFGIAGAAPGAELIAVPVCRPLGATPRDTCGLYDLLRGLDHAWDQGAQVINLSVVGPPNPLLERATARLDDLGAVLVAAAGNEGSAEPRYPAAYPSVVGVGALDADGARAASSNYGPSAEIWAPGAGVLSTVPGGSFAFASGTSFAAAHVSGALAVLIGSGVSPDDARRALFRSAQAAAPPGAPLAVAPLCGALEDLGHGCPKM